jgi:hypothetical protein
LGLLRTILALLVVGSHLHAFGGGFFAVKAFFVISFDPSDFAKEGVSLRFLDFAPFVYDTPGYDFEKDLSIIDILMWNSPDAVVQAIRKNSSLIPVPKEG